MSQIVDTSVVIKWAVREDGWEKAAIWIGRPLIAPDLLRAELGNALWKKVRKLEIAIEHALSIQADMEAFLSFVPVMPLSQRALEIAIELDHAIYDCFYLALAEARQTVVVTADVRLARRCAGNGYERLLEPI